MASIDSSAFRGLVLTAAEIRALTGWPDAIIEDYIRLISYLGTITKSIEDIDVSGAESTVVRVDAAAYNVQTADAIIFADTDIGDIQIRLASGVQSRRHKIVNVGSSGNRVYVVPFGADLLFGSSSSEYLADQEAIDIAYDTTEGWN